MKFHLGRDFGLKTLKYADLPKMSVRPHLLYAKHSGLRGQKIVSARLFSEICCIFRLKCVA